MNPIELMDELEEHPEIPIIDLEEWQSLRAAIEAQAAELAQANDIRDDAINVLAMVAEELGVDQEPHQTFNERLIEAAEKDWYKAYMESSWELAQARARIGRLTHHLRQAHTFIESTEAFGNSASDGILQAGDDKATAWNVDESKAALNESEPQSAAALKAKGCTCLTRCDCQDFERGLVSNECPVHNYYPRPSPDCPVHAEREVKEKS